MVAFECWERLHEAVLDLTTSHVTPRQRLLVVAERHLADLGNLTSALSDRELADWIGRMLGRLQGVHNRLSRAALFSTINAMTDEEVDATLIEIVSIYDETTRLEAVGRMGDIAA